MQRKGLQNMRQIKKKKGNIFVEIFDAMFIMLLCFGTLLSAMLMQMHAAAGMKYNFSLLTFGIMVICLMIYMFLVLTHSEKGLKSIIQMIYADHESQQ